MNKKSLISILGAASAVAILATGCSSSSSNSNSSKNSQSSQNKVISQNKELRDNYDKIQVGELTQNGQGGSTIQEVEKLLGKPNSTDTTTMDNVKIKTYMWTKGEVTITVGFAPDKVTSKDITGFKWSKRPEKLTLAAFNNLQDGSSYEDAVKQFGEPDGLNETLIMSKKTITASWLTGVKGSAGANATLTFENNQLTSKNQSELK